MVYSVFSNTLSRVSRAQQRKPRGASAACGAWARGSAAGVLGTASLSLRIGGSLASCCSWWNRWLIMRPHARTALRGTVASGTSHLLGVAAPIAGAGALGRPGAPAGTCLPQARGAIACGRWPCPACPRRPRLRCCRGDGRRRCGRPEHCRPRPSRRLRRGPRCCHSGCRCPGGRRPRPRPRTHALATCGACLRRYCPSCPLQGRCGPAGRSRRRLTCLSYLRQRVPQA